MGERNIFCIFNHHTGRLKFAVDILICTSWTQHFRLFIQSKVQAVGLAYLLKQAPVLGCLRKPPPPALLHAGWRRLQGEPCAGECAYSPRKAAGESQLETPCKQNQWKLATRTPPTLSASPVCECNFPYLCLYTSQ